MPLTSFYNERVIQDSILAQSLEKGLITNDAIIKGKADGFYQIGDKFYYPVALPIDKESKNQGSEKDAVNKIFRKVADDNKGKEIEILFTATFNDNHFIPASVKISKEGKVTFTISDTTSSEHKADGNIVYNQLKKTFGDSLEIVPDKSLKGTWSENNCGPTAVDAALTRIEDKPLSSLAKKIKGDEGYNKKARKEQLDLVRGYKKIDNSSPSLQYLEGIYNKDEIKELDSIKISTTKSSRTIEEKVAKIGKAEKGYGNIMEIIDDISVEELKEIIERGLVDIDATEENTWKHHPLHRINGTKENQEKIKLIIANSKVIDAEGNFPKKDQEIKIGDVTYKYDVEAPDEYFGIKGHDDNPFSVENVKKLRADDSEYKLKDGKIAKDFSKESKTKSESTKATQKLLDEEEERIKKTEDDLKDTSKSLNKEENSDEEKKSTPEEQEEARKKLEEDGLGDTVGLAKKYDAIRKNKLKLSREFKNNIYNPLIQIINSESDVEQKLEEIKALKEKVKDTKERNNGKGKETIDLLFNVVESVLSDKELTKEDKEEFLSNFAEQFPEFKGKAKYQWSVPKTIGDITSKLGNLVEHYQKEDNEVGKSIVKHIATASSQSELLKPLNEIVEKIKESGAANAKNLSKYGSQGFAVFLIIGTALGAPYMLPLALIGAIAAVKIGDMFGNKARDSDREKDKEKILAERKEREELKKIEKEKEQKELKRKQEEAKIKKPLLDEKSKLEDEIKNLELEKAKLTEKAEGGSQTEEDTKRIAVIEEEMKLKTGRIKELDVLLTKSNPDSQDKDKSKDSELENLKKEFKSLDQLIKTEDPELKLSGDNLVKAAEQYSELKQKIEELEKPNKIAGLESQLASLDTKLKVEGLSEEEKTKITEQSTKITAELTKLKTPVTVEDLAKEKATIKNSIIEKASVKTALDATEKDDADLTKGDKKLAEEEHAKELAKGFAGIKVPDKDALPEEKSSKKYAATMSRAERKSFVDDMKTRSRDDSTLVH